MQQDQWPKISIITPSYNQGHFLEQTICSIIGQDYPNLEYIIIDGGSSDNSVEIIKKYEKQLAYWVSEEDGGNYDAINKGFSKATGEILAWLNSDDLYCPWTLRTVGQIFRDTNSVEWLTTLYPLVIDQEQVLKAMPRLCGYSKEAFLDGCYLEGSPVQVGFIQQESTFWKRSLWERAGSLVPTDSGPAGDFALWCNFYKHANLYGFDKPLGVFRRHPQQISANKEDYIIQASRQLSQMISAEKHKNNKLSAYLVRNNNPVSKYLARQLKLTYEGKIVVSPSEDKPFKVKSHSLI